MNGYVRVTYRPEGKRARTVLLGSATASREGVLTGTEVDAEGETRWRKGGTTQTIHVIEMALVLRVEYLEMDKTLGVLVTKAEEPLIPSTTPRHAIDVTTTDEGWKWTCTCGLSSDGWSSAIYARARGSKHLRDAHYQGAP